MTQQIATAVVALLNAGVDPEVIRAAFQHIDGVDFIPAERAVH